MPLWFNIYIERERFRYRYRYIDVYNASSFNSSYKFFIFNTFLNLKFLYGFVFKYYLTETKIGTCFI